ncbi:MAG: hypothetical protein K1060chlam1_00363 [Candidatus Anoxychlamydiales bacterium]|nr:hypothetical protein [Candidatus Anoxychlamydiales bacterium]
MTVPLVRTTREEALEKAFEKAYKKTGIELARKIIQKIEI